MLYPVTSWPLWGQKQWDTETLWVIAIRALWNGSFHPSNSRMRENRKKCKCNFSSLWVTKSYPHASNEIAFHWHSIMDTKSFLQLLWDWCWTHTGTDVFVWLWVNISIVCHAVTFLLFPPFLVSVYLCFEAVLISFFSSLWVLSDWFGTLNRFHLICVSAQTRTLD